MREIVDGSAWVDLDRQLVEIETTDQMRLVAVHKRPIGGTSRPPVLLIHGLGQNRYTWDLSRRSFENYLVASGYETFNVELRGHGLSRAAGSEYPQSFETYLQLDAPAVLARVLALSGARRLFIIGHSLGGTIGYCLGPRHNDQLAGIVSIAGPYAFGGGVPVLRALATVLKLVHDHSLLSRLDLPYLSVDLAGLLMRAGLFYFDHPHSGWPLRIHYPRSIERDLLEERIAKGFDRTGWTVGKLLIRWAATGRFESTEGDIDYAQAVRELRAPLLLVLGSDDDVVPLRSVESGLEQVGSSDKRLRVFGPPCEPTRYGHIDLICGRDAPAQVWPELRAWLDARCPRC